MLVLYCLSRFIPPKLSRSNFGLGSVQPWSDRVHTHQGEYHLLQGIRVAERQNLLALTAEQRIQFLAVVAATRKETQIGNVHRCEPSEGNHILSVALISPTGWLRPSAQRLLV